jgi:hypothetical protein
VEEVAAAKKVLADAKDALKVNPLLTVHKLK